MSGSSAFGVYGDPDPALAEYPADAVQVSPLVPGAGALENLAAESLDGFAMAAPPGTVERRYALALALRALRPGGTLVAMALKAKGGARLKAELESFGCVVEESGRRHQRICRATVVGGLTGIDDAIATGGPQRSVRLGLWTQPGVFSWDRIDPGTALLLALLPPLAGAGADLGCGVGVIARALLADSKVKSLQLIDIDRRAIEAARRNVDEPRASFHWADARQASPVSDRDFVVMNPPFHDTGLEDKALGQTFIRSAHGMLRKGGVLWLVANRHLPYEAALTGLFKTVTARADAGGFKVYEARR